MSKSKQENLYNILNKYECNEIVKSSLNNKNLIFKNIINFNIKNAPDEYFGLLGEYFKLIVTAELENYEIIELEYFIKSIPISDIINRNLIQSLGVIPKEVTLYTKLFKEIDKYSPSNWHGICHYARPDMFVMDDLFKSGYRNLRESETFTIEHLKIALKNMASMHATSIIYEEKTGMNIGKKYKSILVEISVDRNNNWFNAGLMAIKTVAEIHPKYQNSTIKEFISKEFFKQLQTIYDIAEPSNNYRNVLAHRDCWDKNILFKYDATDNSMLPTECVFVDYQLTRYNLPALDVLILIYLNISSSLRDFHLNELLEYYYNHLKIFTNNVNIKIENILTYEDFLKSCNYVKLLPLVLKGIYIPFTLIPKQYFIELQNENPEKFNYYLTVDRTEMVMRFINENEGFKDEMFNSIEDIIDKISTSIKC